MNVGEERRSAFVVAAWLYGDERFRQLRSPSVDAEQLADVLEDAEVGGYVVDKSLNEDNGTVRRRLDEFFADRRPVDTLLLHVSCHGVKDASGELYFALADTRLDRLLSTGVSSSFVNRLIHDSRAGRVVVFLDCCYSGAFTKGLVARADDQVDVEERFAGEGRAVITASKATEYAFENNELVSATPEAQPSVFTTALVKGLRSGDADLDRDGLVSFSDIYGYVYDEVVRATENQTPGVYTQLEGRLYVARSRRPAELPASLREAIENDLAPVRLASIASLAKLVAGHHPGYASAARAALEKLGSDDSKSVADAAAKALAAAPPVELEPEAETEPEEEPEPEEEQEPKPEEEQEPKPEEKPKLEEKPEPQPEKEPAEPGGAGAGERITWFRRDRIARRWIVAAAAGIGALVVVIVLLLVGGGGGARLDWERTADASTFGGTGRQVVNGVTSVGSSQAFAVGYDYDRGRAVQAAWELADGRWHRVRPFREGTFDAVAASPGATGGGIVAVAVGRSGPSGRRQGAALWARRGTGWAPACGSQCGDAAAPGQGPGPRTQEILAVTALTSAPGVFVAVGFDQDTAGDGKYDAAVWRLDASGRARRVALDEPSLGGERQQQMRAVVETAAGLVAVGQNGPNAGVWQSADGGEHWERSNDDAFAAGEGTALDVYALTRRGDDLVAVGVETDEQGNAGRAATWLLRASSGAWERGSSSDFKPRGQRLRDVVVAPGGELVAVGYDTVDGVRRAAVWTSSDGLVWQRREGVPDEDGDAEMAAVSVLGAQLVAGGVAGRPTDADARIWTAPAPTAR